MLFKQTRKDNKMINNFPLRRMIEQLVQEGEINNKEGEIFKIFENLPFNPTLEQKKDCLSKIKKGNLKKDEIKEKKWEQLRKFTNPTKRDDILARSIWFDKDIEKMPLEKEVIMAQVHLLILKESLKVLKK